MPTADERFEQGTTPPGGGLCAERSLFASSRCRPDRCRPGRCRPGSRPPPRALLVIAALALGSACGRISYERERLDASDRARDARADAHRVDAGARDPALPDGALVEDGGDGRDGASSVDADASGGLADADAGSDAGVCRGGSSGSCTPGLDCPGDPCFAVECGAGGCCELSPAGPGVCVCLPGYRLLAGRCWDVAAVCVGVSCSGHGRCVQTGDVGSCECEAGYQAFGLACVPAGTCPPDAPGGTSCPTPCTGGCPGGVCMIDCSAPSACQTTMLVCPPGWPCRLLCSGPSACQNSWIRCPTGGSCDLQCSGSAACQSSRLACGTGAPCAATCGGTSASLGLAQCNEACSCDVAGCASAR